MLRTNLAAKERQTYVPELLNSLMIATFTSKMDKIPIGGYTFKMWFRVAGRIDPSLVKPGDSVQKTVPAVISTKRVTAPISQGQITSLEP